MSPAPRFGLILSNRGVTFGVTTPRELLDLSQTADESGLVDSVWVGDSLLAKPRLEAVTLLAAVAARTERVRLATACLSSFPLRNPLQLAQQWASLDLLAGGRTILVACLGGGVGGGEFTREYRTFGVDPKERAGRLEEGIELIRRLWSEERVTHRGRHYAVEDLSLEPKPATPPPIWIANNPDVSGASATVAEKALRRVARLADGWMTAFVSPDRFATNLATIGRFMREEGRAPDRFPTALYFNVNVNENREAAFEETRRYFEAYYGAAPSTELLEGCLAWGPPDECAEKIVRFFRSGVETVGLRLTSWDQNGQLRRVLSEVIPACLARS